MITYFRKHSYSSELVLFKTHIELENMIAQATVERKRLTTRCSGHTDSYTDASNGSNRVIHRRFGSYTLKIWVIGPYTECSGCFCPAVVSTVYIRPTPHLGRIQIDVFTCFELFIMSSVFDSYNERCLWRRNRAKTRPSHTNDQI